MKRKHERRLTQLLDRIEAEQAEMLDGLVQVDERSSRHHHRLNEMDARLHAIESRLAAPRLNEMDARLRAIESSRA